MDAASTNASPASKVIVQCVDSSNLFDVVAPLLKSRLPLSNLHWKSATRPLRSIDSLDVSLIREEPNDPKAATRHQIPGLRQTPYVKVYLLRCDDKDKYRDTVRKELKDWVKSLAISTSGKSTVKGQERHDAFEYLIVHVVLPGTPAAAQPKSSKHISLEASDSTDSVNSTSKSKWTGKSSSTIYDKLRADFHSSSKAPFERVAQVRISDTSKPGVVLSPLEIEEQWQDLLEKLRTAILHSFDARVAQYEEDIREREAQRSLPGWNFCTFFILKEGLARGFENVGLLEDAMKVYEELDAGLDVVIQDQAKDDYTDATNALLPYATDLKDTIRKVLGPDAMAETDALGDIGVDLQAWAGADSKQFPWRLERRDYQRMILTNQVSALDFRIYIFIRQMQIMLRRANVPLQTTKSKATQSITTPRWDANILSNVCERSIRFLGLAARNLKQDLFAAWGGREGLPESERQIQSNVIDNIVSSWKWSSLLQTLSECQVVAALNSSAKDSNHHQQRSVELFDASDISERWRGRKRNHSVTTHSSGENGSLANGTGTTSHRNIFSAIHVVQGSKDAFIFQVAEIFLMLRNIVRNVGKEQGMLPTIHLRSDEIAGSEEATSSNARGILATSLQYILKSAETTEAAYKMLTVCACQCYLSAGKTRAPRQLCFDLAKLNEYSGNYDTAIAWLDSVYEPPDESNHTPMDHSILELYISCLRESKRYEELCHKLLMSLQVLSRTKQSETTVQLQWNEMTESAEKGGSIKFPFDSIFAISSVENSITHISDAGGFGIRISLQALIPIKSLGKGEVVVEIQTKGQNMPENILLRYAGPMDFQNNVLEVLTTSSVITEGWYKVTRLEILIGLVSFEHRVNSHAIRTDDGDEQTFSDHASFNYIFVYPNHQAPSITILDGPVRDLSQRRSASVTVNWRFLPDSISAAQLRLKPATAGLRLDLQSLADQGHTNFNVTQLEDTQIIEFTSFEGTEVLLDIPYIIENHAIPSIAIRANLNYTTAAGDFQLFETLSASCILPINVNVQDSSQAAGTFSQFTFLPSRPIPTRINDCSLVGRGRYHVLSNCPKPMPIDAFPKQPASWTAKIVDGRPTIDSDTNRLQLTISYKCADEAILRTVKDEFVRSIIGTSFAHVLRPLLAHLLSKMQSIWTEQEIEIAMLTGEIDMWTFDDLDWTSLLHAFKGTIRTKLTLWLHQWHENHRVLQLHIGDAPQRMLKLLVDAPQPLVTLTTSFEVTPKLFNNSQQGTRGMVGRPLSMRLRIISRCSSQTMNDTVEVSVEIVNQHDLWLIGGTRKVAFSLSRQSFEYDIILVPQKTGLLMLPLIDVKCRKKDDNTQITAEVEHLNCATTVDVRENIQSVALGIGDGESSEGYWLIDGRAKFEA